ncbi:hypothetical protein BDN71DRAFT_1436720 [Pleurotus eryngii]|uniref:Uncharacterized protein n=1 Tax=Pleurotus eryngii TaxID=5323 RepID=A0A9P6D8G3_PLEER|nr:hypothetical protein BDN71DRAFT_1436720 [Pleurotus eryngii]
MSAVLPLATMPPLVSIHCAMYMEVLHKQQLAAVSRLLHETQQQVQMLCDALRVKEASEKVYVELANAVQELLVDKVLGQMDDCAETAGLEIKEVDLVVSNVGTF